MNYNTILNSLFFLSPYFPCCCSHKACVRAFFVLPSRITYLFEFYPMLQILFTVHSTDCITISSHSPAILTHSHTFFLVRICLSSGPTQRRPRPGFIFCTRRYSPVPQTHSVVQISFDPNTCSSCVGDCRDSFGLQIVSHVS